jgi:hypothetical protein
MVEEVPMGVEFATERRLLAENEVDPVLSSHYPNLHAMARADLVSLARWLRQQRAKARDIIYERRRVRRGKGEPRAAGAGDASERGLAAKKQVFARALKRVNTQIANRDAESNREKALEGMRAALARRQAAPVHHPGAGMTPASGMRQGRIAKRPGIITGGRIGSVSQAGKAAQAARDSRG